MRKLLPILLTSAVFLTAGVALAQVTNTDDASSTAGNAPQITFPILELGNCASKDECKTYCDGSVHTSACISFAATHGLMKSDEVQKARDFIKLKGPGGCVGQDCKTYCADTTHADECLSFAKTNHLISDADAKIVDDIKTSGGPGGCKSATECRTFCSDTINHDACTQFAKDHNIIPPRPLPTRIASSTRKEDGGDKIAQILAAKPGPGGCTDAQTCKTYCNDSTHIDECVQFAKDNGLMTGDQADQARKFDKPGPGGCVGEACKEYCSDTTHLDECRQFAMENGFMPKDDHGQFQDGSSTQMHSPMNAPDTQGQGPRDQDDRQSSSSRPDNFQQPNNSNDPSGRPSIDTSSLKGRCTTPDECKKLICTEHPDACENGVPKINTVLNPGALMPTPPQSGDTQTQIQARCAEYGGTWDGQRCTKPNMPGNSGNTDTKMPPRPSFPVPTHSEPSSMKPLSIFGASVLAIFQGLLN